MELIVNGKKEILNDKISLMEYLSKKDENPESFVIEYNGEIVKRETWKNIELKEDDCLEILKFVGGG